VREASRDQRAEIRGLLLGRNECPEALPGIARTFDDFDWIIHWFFLNWCLLEEFWSVRCGIKFLQGLKPKALFLRTRHD
jgi:hypothetical protein